MTGSYIVFTGVVLHLLDDGLSILQYVDDTILFLEKIIMNGLRI